MGEPNPVYAVNQVELVEKISVELKSISPIKPPVWAAFVKTGVHKERPPVSEDWWYLRAASVLRKVFLLGPIGVEKLRTLYGGKKSRGYDTEHFRRGSGNIARKILQQLEKAGLVKKDAKGAHKGRVVTPSGIKLLNKVGGLIASAMPKQPKPVAKQIPQVQEEPAIAGKPAEKAVKPKKERKKAAPQKKGGASEKESSAHQGQAPLQAQHPAQDKAPPKEQAPVEKKE
ncbi:30S ribosomal protein S19e [Candidatus Woesearchaeota archaeon]|nr:30S ribosomal protein S19e [Candidatus Woesearchaeota archaeon]